jgi:hypothetical protein
MKFLRLILICSLLILPKAATSGESSLPEYEIKAAFLYNFGKFIEWPPAEPHPSGPDFFSICILGNDPFGKSMDAIQEKTIRGLRVKVFRAASIDELLDHSICRILFISPSEKEHLGAILSKIEGYPILTVADHEGAADSGVMINFDTLDERVRFEINLNAATKVGIRINSKLLKLAVSIKE